MDLDNYMPYVTALLVFGGIAIIGSAAGARYAIGIIAESGCSAQITGAMTPCQLAIAELNSGVKTLLVGGGFSTVAGLVGIRYQNASASDTSPPTEA